MNMRLIRVLLVFIAIAIISSAGYLLKQADQILMSERAAADSLRDQARTLTAWIGNVRTAQVAYVAHGQGEDFWMSRVAKLMPGLQQQMADFGSKLTVPAAQAAFEPASAALENLQKLDTRAQDFVRGGNGLLASDLIFSDGLEATTIASNQVDMALGLELQTRQAVARDQRRSQLAVLGGGAGGLLLVTLILGLTGAAPRKPEEPVRLVERVERVVAPAQPAQPIAEVKAPQPNLATTAAVCTALARVVDSKELPALLERTAKVLDASGMIVWLADGNSLKPAMSFGYPDQVVMRMGNIHRDANNAAAAAYRSEEMRTVIGDRATNGALVVPLLTSDGCIGVLSAEMKGGAEKDESSQALAAIFAAQLATLVSPPISAVPRAAAQG